MPCPLQFPPLVGGGARATNHIGAGTAATMLEATGLTSQPGLPGTEVLLGPKMFDAQTRESPGKTGVSIRGTSTAWLVAGGRWQGQEK